MHAGLRKLKLIGVYYFFSFIFFPKTDLCLDIYNIGQAAMNITSQAGQSVSGATPQRNMPSIHLTSPYFLHHLQVNLSFLFLLVNEKFPSLFHFNNNSKF